MKTLIVGRLAELGWDSLGNSRTAIAMKEFQTAVGPKVAHIYLTRGDGVQRSLQGDYQSEGRNILEAWGRLVPVDAEPDRVRQEVDQFVKDIERQIGQSYAARLLGH